MARRPPASLMDAADAGDGEEIVCEARRERLGELLAFVERACARAALEPDVAFDVRLATEEAVTNVIEHGYADATPGPIILRFHRDPRQVVVTVEDRAPHFDPSSIRPADPTAPLERRSVGGLGWHFVTQVMDEARHEPRHPLGNRLTLIKRLLPADRTHT